MNTKPLAQQLKEYYEAQAEGEKSTGWKHLIECLISAVIIFAFALWMLWLTARTWPVYLPE